MAGTNKSREQTLHELRDKGRRQSGKEALNGRVALIPWARYVDICPILGPAANTHGGVNVQSTECLWCPTELAMARRMGSGDSYQVRRRAAPRIRQAASTDVCRASESIHYGQLAMSDTSHGCWRYAHIPKLHASP